MGPPRPCEAVASKAARTGRVLPSHMTAVQRRPPRGRATAVYSARAPSATVPHENLLRFALGDLPCRMGNRGHVRGLPACAWLLCSVTTLGAQEKAAIPAEKAGGSQVSLPTSSPARSAPQDVSPEVRRAV